MHFLFITFGSQVSCELIFNSKITSCSKFSSSKPPQRIQHWRKEFALFNFFHHTSYFPPNIVFSPFFLEPREVLWLSLFPKQASIPLFLSCLILIISKEFFFLHLINVSTCSFSNNHSNKSREAVVMQHAFSKVDQFIIWTYKIQIDHKQSCLQSKWMKKEKGKG